MNAEDLAEAWTKGNEESIGWVYQAFNSKELKDAFAAGWREDLPFRQVQDGVIVRGKAGAKPVQGRCKPARRPALHRGWSGLGLALVRM
jgi:hypothetical protein